MGLSPKKIKNATPVDKPYKLVWRWVLTEVCAIRPQTLAKMRNSAIVVAVATLALTPRGWPQKARLLAGAIPKTGLRAALAAQTNSQWASVSPLTIQANQNASVTVTANIPAQYGTSLQPHVFRLNRQTGQATDLGTLSAQRSASETRTIPYTARLNFREKVAGQILLQVKLQLPGNVSAERMAQAGPVTSGTMTVTVLAPTGGGTTQTGGSAGGFLGGLLNGIGQALGNHSGSQPPANSGVPIETGKIGIRYPDGWAFNQQLLDQGGPISLRNFKTYQQGGVVPPNGAEIEIATTQLTAASIDAAMAADLGHVTENSDSVSGVRAVRGTYTDEYPGFSLSSVAVYVANGNELYKFFLTWRSGDPKQASYLDSFNQVLQTVRFK
ncbi:MAG TPA: hypothetical protein VFW30_05705 [Bryocella sp.]|nr:hypothetical protein [Bryocella sp.]